VTHVLIAGGGTGGHVFPGLAVAAELRARDCRVTWLGARRGIEVSRVPAAGIRLVTVAVTGAVGRSRLAQLGALASLVPALLAALATLLRERVDAVVAVGGYAALPGALAAAALGVPFVLQEQNALPGLTNRLLAPWSEAIACGFAAAVPAFPSLPAFWSGNPVRAEFFAVPPSSGGRSRVLVLGGSQGSAFLNERVPAALALLAQRGRAVPVVHQAGPRWEEEVRARYATVGVAAQVTPFLEDPARAVGDADLVVARAGALTVTELAAARRAAILVPFAAAAHGHQGANARALAALGAADVVEERSATPDRLADLLQARLAEPGELAARGARGAALARRDAAATVAHLAMRRGGGA
jgi:UDP-N-acetylglucosamine--N-acetylmuramyl-(pentapeptide) pyrophosphoryl-undecaprenol N-acetylglucosamine transferase